MTHDDIRAHLPAYAAGALIGPSAEAVRAHLATGCAACLAGLYALPMGLPRAPERMRRVRSRWGRGAGLAAAMGVAAAAGWFAHQGIGWEAGGGPPPSAPVQADEGEVARLAEGLALERQRADRADRTAEEATALATAARDGAAVAQREAADRLAVLNREVRERDAEIAHLRALIEAAGDLETLALQPGLRVLGLHAVGPFRAVSGQVLWNPDQEVAVVSVRALPRLPGEGIYRVRVIDAAGTSVAVGDLSASARGGATLSLRVPAGTTVGGVDVIRDPPGDTVATGRIADAK